MPLPDHLPLVVRGTAVGELHHLRGVRGRHAGDAKDQDGAAPGLFFLGYTVSLRGMLRDIAADADKVAAEAFATWVTLN